jgi:hypothetical protein
MPTRANVATMRAVVVVLVAVFVAIWVIIVHLYP